MQHLSAWGTVSSCSGLPEAQDATEGRGRGGGEGGYNAAAPLSPGQVVTEVDAWDQAVRGLLSGLTPEQVQSASRHMTLNTFLRRTLPCPACSMRPRG